MTATTVGVIVPAYNAAPYLAETLDSLLAQTLRDWLAVVVDDGSSDNTAEIAFSYQQRDPRISLKQIAHRGVSAARNVGLAALKDVGYFAFLDSDDLWHPEKLQRQLQQAIDGHCPLVFCGYRRFGPGAVRDPDWSRYQGPHSGDQLLRKLASSSFLIPSCLLLEARVLEAVGGFDESLGHAEDWDLAMRVAVAGYSCLGIKCSLVRYRCRSGSLSDQVGRCFLDTLTVLDRHLPPDLRQDPEVLGHLRLRFRNDFTREGGLGRFELLDTMLQGYLRYDGANGAARVMVWLRRFLPPRPFWFLSRYAVIPLAWHLERWTSRR
jgi:glycosyltransferase involved in cell wall biosynthesis